MEIIKTSIDGVLVIKPSIFGDSRGYFFESYNQPKLAALGFHANFLQDNESCSARGVLRGLHLQLPPYTQGKLVRVIKGSVFDVAVDLRKGSPTYGKWTGIELSEENKLLFWIPEGFAHGFQSLEDGTIFAYKCTNVYDKASEASLVWNDPDLNIDWPIKEAILAEKDMQAGTFRDFMSPF